MQLPRSAQPPDGGVRRASCCCVVVVMSHLLVPLAAGDARPPAASPGWPVAVWPGRWHAAGRAEAQDWQLAVGHRVPPDGCGWTSGRLAALGMGGAPGVPAMKLIWMAASCQLPASPTRIRVARVAWGIGWPR